MIPFLLMAGLGAAGAIAQSGAARSAADAQTQAAQMGIEEQRRQFDTIRGLLSPYVNAGNAGIAGMQNLIGLGGADQQQSAIDALRAGPEFQALTQEGQNAILQNASATGGLRGGNTQAALAQFQPRMLADLINQQYSRLGGLASIGQSAAGGVASAASTTGANVSNLMQQQGAAQAGAAMARGNAFGNFVGGLGSLYGQFGVPSGYSIAPKQGAAGNWGGF